MEMQSWARVGGLRGPMGQCMGDRLGTQGSLVVLIVAGRRESVEVKEVCWCCSRWYWFISWCCRCDRRCSPRDSCRSTAGGGVSVGASWSQRGVVMVCRGGQMCCFGERLVVGGKRRCFRWNCWSCRNCKPHQPTGDCVDVVSLGSTKGDARGVPMYVAEKVRKGCR